MTEEHIPRSSDERSTFRRRDDGLEARPGEDRPDVDARENAAPWPPEDQGPASPREGRPVGRREEQTSAWPREDPARASPSGGQPGVSRREEQTSGWPREDDTAAWAPQDAATASLREGQPGVSRREEQTTAWPREDETRLRTRGEQTAGWPRGDEPGPGTRDEQATGWPLEDRAPAMPREEHPAAGARLRHDERPGRAPEEAAGWPSGGADGFPLEPEREEELRSFVESDALPPAEKMEAAERQAEREARGDAGAPSALQAGEPAGASYAGEPSPQQRPAPGRGRERPSRTVDARLARLHLRGALIALARAELETMAGQGTLDLDALADLAEARWRSGDLLGAGEAAQAHLARGGDELIALVVAVEALTAQGRTIDARRLATEAMSRSGGNLDALFAGQPRAHVWPTDGATRRRRPAPLTGGEAAPIAPEEAMRVGGEAPTSATGEEAMPVAPEPRTPVSREEETPGTKVADARGDGQLFAAQPPAGAPANGQAVGTEAGDRAEAEGREVAQEPEAVRSRAQPEHAEPGGVEAGPERADVLEAVEVEGEPSELEPGRAQPAPGTVRELRAIESTLDAGRVESVAGRLALVLRTDPALAGRILDVASRALELSGGSGVEAANLHIVRGDVFRVLGRGREAERAYEQSRGALEGNVAKEVEG